MDFARTNSIDLTIVGPEGPLAAGVVDKFRAEGLRIVGPDKEASRLESSKGFAKDFMRRHKIPTADYCIVDSAAKAVETLRSGRFGSPEAPVVIKADGLAAGKGVIVASSRAEAEHAVMELTGGELVSSDAIKQIVLEEALLGREVSVLLFSDGSDYALMPAARDHKRVGENDTGPNTGGMGAITDPTVLESSMLETIIREVVEPSLRGAASEGFPFRGILFIGLMLTATGPKVLEYNVRFGDPETQAILVRLESDLLQILVSVANGSLKDAAVEWSEQSSACVVLASDGYPGKYKSGFAIKGLDVVASGHNNVQVFHAGTTRSSSGELVTAGGRVLGITATGDNLGQALENCYAAIQQISWEGMRYRRDIGRFKETSGTAN
jgi:phosphoribosylamine--glycine ligase